jgi:thioredoxin-dependent peroxiredoxin
MPEEMGGDGMAILSEGEKAPDFSLPDAGGRMVKLSDFAGKRLVIYFYPKDDTPGCTVEACGFRDSLPKFGKLGVPVVGISPDDEKSHVKFMQKYRLNFTLLADQGAAVARKFGVWGRKKFMGREYEGIMRTTFVIGKGGIVEKVFESVKPEGHEKEVLAWLNDNQG